MGILTVELVAACAAMAGCTAQHMPLLLAIVEALQDPGAWYAHQATTTGCAALLVRPGRRHHVAVRPPSFAAPIVVGHQAPKGRHAVVVAVDAATGDVRWRVTTPGWSLRALAVTGDVVTMLTVGGDTEPCRDVLRRLTLGVAEGTTLSLENRPTSAPQYPPTDYTVRDGYLIHLDGATEGWRVALAPLGMSRAGYVVAGSGVVVVSSDGELPLQCHT
jgi:hypothetical protein